MRPWFNESKGTKILFFIARVLLMQGIFIMKLITEELRIKFFIAGISLLKGLLFRSFMVLTLEEAVIGKARAYFKGYPHTP